MFKDCKISLLPISMASFVVRRGGGMQWLKTGLGYQEVIFEIQARRHPLTGPGPDLHPPQFLYSCTWRSMVPLVSWGWEAVGPPSFRSPTGKGLTAGEEAP